MKSVLEELFFGKFIPYEHIGSKDPEFISINQEIGRRKEVLKSMLKDDGYKQLEELENLYTESSNFEAVNAFSVGFKLATILLIEVFTGMDELLKTNSKTTE